MCPARLILLADESREDLAGERIAQIYASPTTTEPARRLADHLGVRLTVLPELIDESVRHADAAESVRRADAALREIADQHRGETVVVIAPRLNLGFHRPQGKVVIEHTGDGWSVLPGENEVTLAAYEQAAERFRESIPRGPNVTLIELFDLIGVSLAPGSTVLELGSGTGRDAVELERRGFRVRRTDAAGSFVEMIRADGFEVDRLNALTDDFGGPYDLMFADAVFLHFDRAQLRTVLKKATRQPATSPSPPARAMVPSGRTDSSTCPGTSRCGRNNPSAPSSPKPAGPSTISNAARPNSAPGSSSSPIEHDPREVGSAYSPRRRGTAGALAAPVSFTERRV
jgi:hypothetical protein